MINEIKFLLDTFLDLPLRLKYKTLSFFEKKDLSGKKRSDSEHLAYAKFISNAVDNERLFINFRRNFAYRQILEHVSYPLGNKYLKKFETLGHTELFNEKYLHKVDRVGNPRRYSYSAVGKVSPTTLRYLATASEICQIFELRKVPSLVISEIGIGYGGQLLALNQMLEISTYNSYDLKCVQELAHRYLLATKLMPNIEKVVVHRDIENIVKVESDLLISNYALSELPAEIQSEYLEKLARNSKRGYLIMNSGKTNHTGRSTGKLEVGEFLSAIPGAEIFPEKPLSGEDNYLLVWGHRLPPEI